MDLLFDFLVASSDNEILLTTGASDATSHAFQEDLPLISMRTQLAHNLFDSAKMVRVFVCDYNGITQLVRVPVGTTLG